MSNSISAARSPRNPARTSRSSPMPTADGVKKFAARSSILASGQMTPTANGRRFCGPSRKTTCWPVVRPADNREGLTVQELVNHFLTAKEQQRDAGDISPRSFADYVATGKRVAAAFGIKRLVDDLDADRLPIAAGAICQAMGAAPTGRRSSARADAFQVRIGRRAVRSARAGRPDVQAAGGPHHAGASAKERREDD